MYENTIAFGRDELWADLAKKTTPEFVEAMRDMYSIYSVELVDWFASLYDTKIGGFYYSQAARDNATVIYNEREYDLLPDAESTCQALGFIGSSGLSENYGGSYAKALPEWMAKQIADYIYSLQDPDGYFYHPQWGKEIPLSRRGRDLSWSIGMLKAFGREPKYKTVLDVKDEKPSEATLIPDHLSSKAKFIDYLESLDINNNSYSVGNQLSSQFAQMMALGLGDICVDFLDAHQNSEGHWHNELNYYAINGIMKISGIYGRAGRPLPNAMAAAESAIFGITSDQPIRAVVDLWNTWIATGNIINNLKQVGATDSVDAIIKKLWDNAPQMVLKSKEKILPFRKEMSSFSYTKIQSSPTSQGMPVTLPRTPEGDVNATVISASLMLGSIFGTLGIPEMRIKMFGNAERERFIAAIEKRR